LGGGGGGFLVITVSHPTFCCVGVVVEVGLGCDNRFRSGCEDFLAFNVAILYLGLL